MSATVTLHIDPDSVEIDGDSTPGAALRVFGAHIDGYIMALHRRVPDPAPSAMLPDGSAFTLGWWFGAHGVTSDTDERWPRNEQTGSPTPADHVWSDDGTGRWTWNPAVIS